MSQLVVERILESISSDELLHTTYILVGRGSSDPDALATLNSIANEAKERLGVPCIHQCYLAAATPTFKEGIAGALESTNGPILVIPYLMFSGTLLHEIDEYIGEWQQLRRTEPLNGHPQLEAVLEQRVQETLEQFEEAVM